MKNILVTILLGMFFVSCSNTNNGDDIKIDKIVISYSMVEQSIDLDDSRSLNLFLENGFDYNFIDENGETLLMKIVKSNSLKCLNTLLSYDVNLEVETPIKERKNRTSYETSRRAVDFVKSKKALDLLIKKGININYTNNLGIPLIINFIKNEPNSYIERLIVEGANLNIEDKEGWTPLMWATSKKNKEIVESLIENGADINISDERTNTAIYYAYDNDIITMFLKGNLDKEYKNKDGENILGEVYLRSVSNSYYSSVEKIIELGGDRNYSSYGDTPMSIASENKDKEMIELLKKLEVEI